MSKKVTIKDVAKEAGVSIGTVDRVIHKRGRYSSKTAKIVNDAIKRLNYKPSEIASALVTMRKKLTIGVAYPYEPQSSELFWEEVRLGVAKAREELIPFGIDVIEECPPSFSSKSLQQSIINLISRNVSAIVTTAFNNNTVDEGFKQFIPSQIPYATAINRSWDNNYLFHIGPNDEAMGALIAKLIALYCGKNAKIAIIAPNMEVEGSQKRINGFLNKIKYEFDDMKIYQISPILAHSIPNAYSDIYDETKRLLSYHPYLDAIYVINGFVKTCAQAIKDLNSRVKVFGHEYFLGEEAFLDEGIICATVHQDSGKQWYDAIMTMVSYLNGREIPQRHMLAGCNLILKETLPFWNATYYKNS